MSWSCSVVYDKEGNIISFHKGLGFKLTFTVEETKPTKEFLQAFDNIDSVSFYIKGDKPLK